MKFYAVRHKLTGEFVNLGRQKRRSWGQFPTNVMKQNIPAEELSDYEVCFYDLQRIQPMRKYNFKKQIIR